MFSTTIPINVTMPGGQKVAKVRFPTDEEWIARAKARKLIVKNLGRDRRETETIGAEEADAKVFEAIKRPESAELDPSEAVMLLERLASCEVTDATHEGSTAAISLRLPGDVEAVHRLRIPTAKDILDYRRGISRVVEMSHGKQQVTINIGVAGALWDKLTEGVEGYTDAVPVIHKTRAIAAAIELSENVVFDDGSRSF